MPVWRFEAIGTVWEIESAEPLRAAHRDAVSGRIDAFDREWSRFRADSLVTRLGIAGGRVPAPADAAAMLDLYRALSDATHGAINPLVGESLTQLGYDAALTLSGGEPLAAPERWHSMLRWDDGDLSLTEPAVIDVGALGKGRLVDLVLAELAEVPGGLVIDAGGDIALRGGTQRIALEHPFDTSQAVGVVALSSGSLCASATNRRVWGDGLHHVLDARTGTPVRAIVASWALAPHAIVADAVSTALFFDEGPRLAAAWGVEWARMTSTGAIEWSPAFPGELFI